MEKSSAIKFISHHLDAPHLVNDNDLLHVHELVKSYPYLLPARYIEAAGKHKQEPFAPDMMAMMQLYMGNWLFFCKHLQSAAIAGAQQKEKIEQEPLVSPEEASLDLVEQLFANRKPKEKEEIPQPAPVAVAEPIKKAEEIISAPPLQKKEEEKPFYMESNFLTEENVAAEEAEIIKEQDLALDNINFNADLITNETGDNLILPIYTEDYFLHQGIQVSNEIPEMEVQEAQMVEESKVPQSLMVVMSFSEWLLHFKRKNEEEKEEQDDRKALKTMWQKEKLAAAMEEENEEIPENVFNMAVNSITKEEGLVSEALAEVYEKQGKYDKAIEMYRKLSLRNPQKNTYFARKIEAVLKEKES